eukprot:TRINITY_DN51173_c0_g1_i1.p2 TRINITY_DN51173_c0_g1~~TRINITY_DN51173_c0_g1_i1.p2  ORF type:complete len:835 (+),score=263.17 TRINITY_DN51173_c0_g1_i1:82-2586(+)
MGWGSAAAAAAFAAACAAVPLSSSAWEHVLQPLEGECRRLLTAGYVYEWCHRSAVRQYHSSMPVALGHFDEGLSTRPLRHVFTGGDGPCAGQAARECVVQFVCCEGLPDVGSPPRGNESLAHPEEEAHPAEKDADATENPDEESDEDAEDGDNDDEGEATCEAAEPDGEQAPAEGRAAGEWNAERLLHKVHSLLSTGVANLPPELVRQLNEHVAATHNADLADNMAAEAAEQAAAAKAAAERAAARQPPEERLRKGTYLRDVSEDSACMYRASVCTPAACGSWWRREEKRGTMPPDVVRGLRDEARGMFYHAYDGYMRHAFPEGELRPVSCTGGAFSLVNISGLTLIDTLDTLAVMGNASEFRRAVDLVVGTVSFDLDVNVSVFETTIRVLGGLLSAHVLATSARFAAADWPYNGGLLRLAHDLGGRLLAAFPPTGSNMTGIPYGTVNLRRGVPPGETKVASVAGAGSLSIEFSALSALTGDPGFAYAANYAARRLFELRSPIGLVGKHINIATGEWTESTSSIGTNADSFFEYLFKAAVLFGDDHSWTMFEELYEAVMAFQAHGDWYADVHMSNGQSVRHRAEGLYAFWPGLQAMLGDHGAASRTLNALMSVWKQTGFLPEGYEYKRRQVGRSGNDPSYLLRPELVESLLFVRRASGDDSWLWAGRDVLMSLQRWCHTKCGYAAITDVGNATYPQEDSMPSFLLSETVKYLWLLFEDAASGHWVLQEEPEWPGGWVFTTEAHPFPVALMRGRVPGMARATAAKGRGTRPRAEPLCPNPGAPDGEWAAGFDPEFLPDSGPPEAGSDGNQLDEIRQFIANAFSGQQVQVLAGNSD